jgi:hypothetical protein
MIKPVFMRDTSDTNSKYEYMNTKSTGWSMHNSNQNDCVHIKTEGRCYSFDCDTKYTPKEYPDIPLFDFSGTGSASGIGNYVFPYETGLDIIAVRPTASSVTTLFLIAYNVWEPVEDHHGWYIFYSWGNGAYQNSRTGEWVWNAHNSSIMDFYTSAYIVYYDPPYSYGNWIGRYRIRLECDLDSWEVRVRPWGITRQYSFTPVISRFKSVTLLKPAIASLDLNQLDRAFEIDWDLEDAMTTCLNQVNFFDSNGLAFAHDVGSLPTTILGDLENLKSLAKVDPTGKLKVAAKAFLSVHYGYKLLAADGIELANELMDYTKKYTKHLAQTIQATWKRATYGDFILRSANGHLNVYYDPFAKIGSDILSFAEAIDIVPDFSNIWDMIPFSFVVDWFTNIGDLAQGIDDYFTLTQQCEVLGSIVSRIRKYTYQPKGFVGELDIQFYNRSCMAGWYPIPDFSFQLKNPVTNLYHWLEGSALVVSTIP